MAKEKPIIYKDRRYLKNRLAELRAFFDTSLAKNLSSEVIEGLFTFLLAKQDPNGSWPDAEGKWTGVQTAVTLKALKRLGYTISSTWPIVQGGSGERGGVGNALAFFERAKEKIHPENVPNKLIEDIWDVCQVLLAFASYGKEAEFKTELLYLESNWQQLYDEYLDPDKHDWSGPAFLAAMLDVFVSYNSSYSIKQKVLKQLMNIGSSGGGGYSGFLWDKSASEPCWHATLVLRTLSQLPEPLFSRKDKTDVFEKFVPALLSEKGTDQKGHSHRYWGKKKSLERHRSMHTARAMEGLASALPYLSEALVDEVIKAIDIGNQYLLSEAKKTKTEEGFPGTMIDTLKSTTAIAEYFATLTSAIPVGTLIDATECLSKQIEINDVRSSMPMGSVDFENVEGGLRIAWLSDLHIADVKESHTPYAMSMITITKRWKLVRSLFQKTKNYWSERFASVNLDLIVDRLAELKPNHILVTGDITNLALKEQFNSAHDKFLSLQSELGVKANRGQLSPEFWTILPGNHDVSKSLSSNRLSEFFNVFGEIYPDRHADNAFPGPKTLRSSAESSDFELELIGLDSTPNLGVEVVGMNARGRITEEQKESLVEKLASNHLQKRFVLLALHHAPLSVPDIKSELTEFFMSLDTKDAKWLITQCCKYSVKAILHGHFHTYSTWKAPVGASNKNMPIVGAPCGTTDDPSQNVEFLELREVKVMKGADANPGLSVIKHKMEPPKNGQEDQWNEKELGVFIY